MITEADVERNMKLMENGEPFDIPLSCLREHPSFYKACKKAYRKTDKCKACKKAYQKTDKYKAYMKAYYEKNKDKYNAYQKTDKYKAYQKAYQKTDKYKDKKKAYDKAYYQNVVKKRIKEGNQNDQRV